MEATQKFVGARCKAHRDAKGWSQSTLARRMSSQPHVTSISDWERGEYAPSSRHLLSMAQALGVPVDQLCSGDDDEEESDEMAADLMKSLRKIVQAEAKRVRKEERVNA